MRRLVTSKWIWLALAVVWAVAAFVLAIAYEYKPGKVLAAVAMAGGYFGLFLVIDWREDVARRKQLRAERMLSRERARIVGDFVHRTGGRRNGDA